MCLFTSARTVAVVFARSAGSEAMYCAGVLTFDGGFMDSSSSRTKCVTERLETSQRQGLGVSRKSSAVDKQGVFCPYLQSSQEERSVVVFGVSMATPASTAEVTWAPRWSG